MAYAGKNGYDEDTDILFPIATNIIGWVGKADREEILDLSFERISLYRCRAEVAGTEFISWKEATQNIFTVEVPDGD